MKKITLALCPLFLASAAVAGSYNAPSVDETPAAMTVSEETVNSSMSSHAAGPYAGLAFGWTKQTVNSTLDSNDRDYVGGQINAGYSFVINDQLLIGPELGWGNYGKLKDTDQKTTATDVVAAGRYYFNEKTNAIVKVGAAYVDGDGSKNTVPMTGLGMGYDINDKINANVTYYHMYGQRDDLSRIDSVFAGVSYFF